MRRSLILALISLFVFSGCAINRKINIDKIDLDPGYSTLSPVILIVQDKREPVIRKKQKPSWCGRANIYNIKTDDGRPISNEFAQILSYALAKHGVKVEKIPITPYTSINEILEEFQLRPEKRLLFVTIKTWESNCTPIFASMRYEVITTFDLKVYDKTGVIIADEEVGDSKVKEQGAGLNMKVLQDLVEVALQEQIKKLFNKQSIKSSLQAQPPTRPTY